VSECTPWHKRGFRVHRLVYRGWYIGQLLLGAFALVSALAPVFLLAMNTISDTLGFALTAVVAGVAASMGALLVWLAIHRLRNPVRPPS
jgi:hypothetical protein